MDEFRELILEHSARPHNAGALEQPTVSHEAYNPLCGDRVRIDLAIESGIITNIRFAGRGCAISQASASLLTDEIKGRALDEVQALTQNDVLALIGIPLGNNPVRIKCALLPLTAIQAGVAKYLALQHAVDNDT